MFIYYELITIMYKNQSTIFGLISAAIKDLFYPFNYCFPEILTSKLYRQHGCIFHGMWSWQDMKGFDKPGFPELISIYRNLVIVDFLARDHKYDFDFFA